ncbi:MAG TPA: hypothetical protein VMW16_10945 [Sedimentisphaerales bacterium]|nr:hypothetical protein [Sedimentisphaerales bacterium]
MAIEAPISRHKKNNLKIYIAVCLVASAIFAYDGYLSKYKWSKRHDFYKKHFIDNGGKPTSTMNFNRKSPPFLIGAAVLLAGYLLAIRNRRIIADQNELVINGNEKIAYDSIQRIDKTHFKSKGFFILTYKNGNDREVNRKLSDRTYDNLAPILDHLVAKIS